MRNKDYLKNKKITIVGLGRSGLACANLLHNLGSDVSVTDNQDNALTRQNLAWLISKDIKVELGRHSQEFIEDRDLIVVSPAVRDSSYPIIRGKEYKIPIVSEIEIAWILCPATVIAITGTNGKTTVTTLIGKILERAEKRVFVCGNIGNPFSQELDKMKEGDFVVLEVSSFQLERIRSFKPKISSILNFSQNHLDRYKNIQDYLEAKKRIFMNQDETDYLVLNFNDPVIRELAKDSKAEVVFFSHHQELNSNQAASLAVASILGIDKSLALEVFRDFKGIPHRLEHVREINHIKFINDSKSTTVDSTIFALENILEPIILIAGGRDKGNDYSKISGLMRQKVRELVLIGEASQKMKDAFKGFLPVNEAISLEEAVRTAFYKARVGDCLLLSPMCASFDMFSNYEERGRVFKKAVYELTQDTVSDGS